MIFSQDKEMYSQDIEITETIPDKEIRSKWEKGYNLSRTFFN